MARLVLVGLPGTGKSTVATAVADRWGCDVVDTDVVIATAVGESAGAYLRDAGEAVFRDTELAALVSALTEDVVVATGGGVVTTGPGRDALRGEVVVWLDGPDEVLVSRLGDVDRPLLGDDAAESLAALRHAREALYREVAQARVEVTGTIEEVATRVVAAVAALTP